MVHERRQQQLSDEERWKHAAIGLSTLFQHLSPAHRFIVRDEAALREQ